ncbi:MAG: MFS transporter [Patulibacter minatonensis]
MTSTTPATQKPAPTRTPAQHLLVLALLGTLMLGILDMNIVTAAATSIGSTLDPANGVSRVPWLVTAYVLASCVVQPIYGKLADRHGAKPVFLSTLGLFIGGSLLCGIARSMEELIAFRALQGLGGGGLMSVTFIVFGHLVAESGEARQTSSLAGLMVGFGLVVGPLLGGLLVDHAGWRWVFLVNLPLAAAAWLVVARTLHLEEVRGTSQVDPLGASLLALTAAAVLLACEWGGRRYGWGSAQILGLAAAAVVLGAAFARRQATAREPFFPPHLLRHRILRVVTVLQVVAGIGLASSVVYLTLDLQLVRGVSPSSTGLHLVPMAFGMALGATYGARLIRNGGPVRAAIAGGQVVAGLALLVLAATGSGVHSSGIALAIGLFLFGAGFGTGLGNELILVQTSVDRTDLGMATSGLRFVETIGAAVGAAAFGVLFASITRRADSAAAIAGALHWVFAVGGVMLLLAAVVAMRLPDVRFRDGRLVGSRTPDAEHAPEGDAGTTEGPASQPGDEALVRPA